jgi:hypothetical protein
MTDMGEAFRKAGHKSPADWLDQAMDEAGDKTNWLRDPAGDAFKAILLDEADDRALVIWELCREVRETAITHLFKSRLFKRQESLRKRQESKETAHRATKSTGAAGQAKRDTQVQTARPPVETLQHSSPSDGGQLRNDTHSLGAPNSAVESQPSPPTKGDQSHIDTHLLDVSGSVADHISEPSDRGQTPDDTQRQPVPSPAQGANKTPTTIRVPPRGFAPNTGRLEVADSLYIPFRGRSIGEYTDADLERTEQRTEYEANLIALVRAALHDRAPWLPAEKLRVADHLKPREIKIFQKMAEAGAKAA